MGKVAYNACFGGFGLSHKATMRYAELKGITLYPFVDVRIIDRKPFDTVEKYRRATDEEASRDLCVHYCTTPEFSNDSYWMPSWRDDNRDDPLLIQVIEELGEAANGHCAKLKIEEVPKGTLWRIDEYDGRENVATQASYDWKVAG